MGGSLEDFFFCGGVIEGSVLLRNEVALLSNRLTTSRRNVVSASFKGLETSRYWIISSRPFETI